LILYLVFMYMLIFLFCVQNVNKQSESLCSKTTIKSKLWLTECDCNRNEMCRLESWSFQFML